MGKNKYSIDPDFTGEILQPSDQDTQFYLNEMQHMNNQMIDMQRDLNRALRESKRMQKELQQSDEIKKALDVSKKANQAKMDFMSRMSHDLRTPMNVIMGLVANTLDDADNPEAVRENMANIRLASDYMLGLVNDILDMAKLEKENLELKLVPYNYNEFLTEMRVMFQEQCNAKGIQLNYRESDINPIILVDKQRLKQVVFNVLSNAVKYTPPGGSITIETSILQVRENNIIDVQCRVIDTGIGMSKEFQEHLFEPFVQEDNSVSPELKGSGLGLSITKRIVEQMGGSIQIESEKDKGTTVIIQLSFEQVPKESLIKDTLDINYSSLQGKTILLVEDHPLNAMIARNLLEKKHMNVLYAENGKKALDLFKVTPINEIDAILMDIRMPVMTGLQASLAIRNIDREDAKTIPIIALSAHTYPEDIQTSLEAGMNAHLSKPINPEELYHTLTKYLS